MGDMADLMINQMEMGESVVIDKLTGKKFLVDNIDIMYGNPYSDTTRYEIKDMSEDPDYCDV